MKKKKKSIQNNSGNSYCWQNFSYSLGVVKQVMAVQFCFAFWWITVQSTDGFRYDAKFNLNTKL